MKREPFIVNRDRSNVTGRRISAIGHVLLFLLCTMYDSPFTPAYAEDIQSKAAVVMDAGSGRVLYAKNPELRLHPASTTKLMTALVVIEMTNLKDVVTVSRRAANTSPTRAGLRAGDKATIETLLYAALMKSANDAAVALAEGVGGTEEAFVELMNRKALAIGANETHFINANGLPGKGQYTTAYDLAKIMRHAIKYPVLKEILGTRITEISTETGKTMFIRNTNKLLWSDEDLVGGKTGYTDQARHCFVCAGERDRETLIVALLGSPRRDLLWKETEALLEVGSRVMNNSEEPVVYLTRADYEALNLTKAAYNQTDGIKVAKKPHKRAKAKKHVLKAGKNDAKKKQYAGKKKSKKSFVKAQKTKKKQYAGKKKSRKSFVNVDKTQKKNVAAKGNDADKG